MNSRRKFLENTSLFALGTILPISSFGINSARKVSANDKIQVGLIGCKGQGFSNLKAFLKNKEVICIAIADIDQNILEERSAELVKLGYPNPKGYADYRKMLENKDIDAVIIGTPDHWHCLNLVDTLEAGKDCYVEKPIGNSIAEINIMANAVKRTNKIVQVGQWQRSQPHFVDAINYLKTNKLGRIRTVKTWSYVDWKGAMPKVPDSTVPTGVDYKMWLGPAPTRPFNTNRFHFTFRWFWDYAGGLMTDWGVHLIDYAMYGMNASTPKSVMAIGGKYAFPNDGMETPDTMTAVYDFGDFTMIWEHTIGIGNGNYGRNHGIAYIGENGTLVLNRGGWEVIAEKNKMESIALQKSVGNGLDLHAANFIECLKNKNPKNLNANIEVGRNVALVSQMGNIAYRTGEKLNWNDQKQNFNSKSANLYLAKEYYNGYKIPKY